MLEVVLSITLSPSFFLCELLMESRSAAFFQFFEWSCKTFLCNLTKSLAEHWPKLYSLFTKFCSAQTEPLKKSATGLRTLLGGFAHAAAVMTKGTGDSVPLLGYGSLCSRTTTDSFLPVGHDVSMVFANVSLVTSANDVSNPTQGDKKGIASNSVLFLIWKTGSAVVFLFVSYQPSYAVAKCRAT